MNKINMVRDLISNDSMHGKVPPLRLRFNNYSINSV